MQEKISKTYAANVSLNDLIKRLSDYQTKGIGFIPNSSVIKPSRYSQEPNSKQSSFLMVQSSCTGRLIVRKLDKLFKC
jgi:hypothetical protein